MFKLFKKKTPADPDSSCVVPRIKHRNMLSALSEMKIPPEQLPHTEPLVADLLVAYAFDLPGLFQMVKEADLQRLDLTPGELRQIALRNLRRQVKDIKIKTEGLGTPVMMLTVGKDLGACLLLIDEVWEDLANQVPGEVVVAVPGRGVVLITSSEWPEGLALMRELTDGAQEREGTHSLSKHFLVRRQDVWLTFQEST